MTYFGPIYSPLRNDVGGIVRVTHIDGKRVVRGARTKTGWTLYAILKYGRQYWTADSGKTYSKSPADAIALATQAAGL